jgi:hypothetical protein
MLLENTLKNADRWHHFADHPVASFRRSRSGSIAPIINILITWPIFHQRDRTIRGHVFCSFLALVLRKELDRCLEQAGQRLEWAEIKQDLKALQTVTIEESGKRFAIRSQCRGSAARFFKRSGWPCRRPLRNYEPNAKPYGNAKTPCQSCSAP